MEFNITKENKNELVSALDRTETMTEYISEPGEYVVTFKDAYLKTWRSGAKSLSLVMETSNGLIGTEDIFVQSGESKGCKTTYTNKDGDEIMLPGVVLIQASLMPCIGLKTLKSSDRDGTIVYKDIINREVGILVNIKKTQYNGKIYLNQVTKGFFNTKTNLTGSEILNGITAPEKKEKIKKALTLIDETQAIHTSVIPTTNTNTFSSDDDLPF